MKKNHKVSIVDVKIDGYTKKGNGQATYVNSEGFSRRLEVPFAVPGDILRAKILRKKGSHYYSQIEEVITPSPDRVPPRCKHFGVCGGCRLQNISYDQELKNKEESIRKCFARFPLEEVKVHPIIPSVSPFEYRNKMEYTFSENKAKDKFLGLMMDFGKGKVLNLTECHLTHSWFIDALSAVRKWWEESDLEAYHAMRNSGALRTLTVREGVRTGDRLVMLTVSGNPKDALSKELLDSFVNCLTEAIEPKENEGRLSVFVRIQQVAKGMATNFYEMLLYGPDAIHEVLKIKPFADRDAELLTFQVSPTAFFQPNTLQAENLYSKVLQIANISKDAVVYDLYCGTGTLGLCIAKYVKQVVSVEISPESTLDARANATLNNINNIIVITSAVRHILSSEDHGVPLPKPDVVLIDPPRPGLDPKALEVLIDLKPEKIVYVSCNPATQVDNIEQLVSSGYRLDSIQPVDQFPQTVHVENIVLLVRKDL